MRFGMAQRKELEFQGNQDQPAVLGDFRIMFAKSRKFLERIRILAESGNDRIDSFADPILEQGKEDVFLALEIGVESAARVARAGGNIFEARGLETVLGEDAFGGRQQFSPGGRGALGLAGAGPRARQAARCLFPVASGLQ